MSSWVTDASLVAGIEFRQRDADSSQAERVLQTKDIAEKMTVHNLLLNKEVLRQRHRRI